MIRRRHLSLVVSNGEPINPRAKRATRRYDRLTTRVVNERGQHVFLPSISPSSNPGAAS